ncbi:hypothetical protein CIK05_09285 [Bdellovibrio sp. qaytius]|nr:hypothetical protein CIK05_09285 [Bdellovibrio sp. qaytius]
MKNSIVISILSFLLLAGCSTQVTTNNASERIPQANVSNPGVVNISDASLYSQVIVISDVHGMFDQVITLLRAGKIVDSQNNWMAGNSLLIVTGDSIDKGPKSLEILNLWIKLQSQAVTAGGDLIHVLGNHEAEFLANPKNSKAAELIAEMKAQNVPLSDLTEANTPRGIFIHSEPVAARVGRWLFCHSGFYPDLSWADFSDQAKQVLAAQDYSDSFLIGSSSILEAKDWEKRNATLAPVISRMSKNEIYGTVFGHQPSAFGIQGRSAAKAGGRLVKIDNGMAPEAGANPGSLLIFTKPSQMNNMAYPQIKVIFPDGSFQSLKPE